MGKGRLIITPCGDGKVSVMTIGEDGRTIANVELTPDQWIDFKVKVDARMEKRVD